MAPFQDGIAEIQSERKAKIGIESRYGWRAGIGGCSKVGWQGLLLLQARTSHAVVGP